MKKHKRCKLMTEYISVWLYSEGIVPKAINKVFLDWINNGNIATEQEIRKAIKESDKEINTRRL